MTAQIPWYTKGVWYDNLGIEKVFSDESESSTFYDKVFNMLHTVVVVLVQV